MVPGDVNSDPVGELKHCREEERYEVNVLSGRLNALLASQAFFVTGWTILHNSTEHDPRAILVVLSSIALIVCLLALAAICAAVTVINAWQIHIAQLIANGQPLEGKSAPQLTNYHIGRRPNDSYHRWGVDVFSLGVSGTFVVMWIILLVYSTWIY